jgi:hypothetical protein
MERETGARVLQRTKQRQQAGNDGFMREEVGYHAIGGSNKLSVFSSLT